MNTTERSSRWVATWLLIGVGMTVIQIALGGITRLTGSGLSITQWDVITGSLPPLHEQQWLAEFEKYKQTPQYHILNFDFTLSDFKFIFFWEWFHRLWARSIGLVFAIGFARYPALPSQLVLHFGAAGAPDRTGPPSQVFGPAVIAFQLFVINLLIALGVYSRGEKLAAYLAWGGSAIVQLFFLIAMVTVAFGN